MDWTGLVVIIIGLILLALVGLLLKPLKWLTNVLINLESATKDLPQQMGDILDDTKSVIHTTNHTLKQLNDQLAGLRPVFQLINQIGSALHHLTTELTAIYSEMKAKIHNPLMSQYRLEGLYGVLALGYAILQRRK